MPDTYIGSVLTGLSTGSGGNTSIAKIVVTPDCAKTGLQGSSAEGDQGDDDGDDDDEKQSLDSGLNADMGTVLMLQHHKQS
jgi:hypothetical protein